MDRADSAGKTSQMGRCRPIICQGWAGANQHMSVTNRGVLMYTHRHMYVQRPQMQVTRKADLQTSDHKSKPPVSQYCSQPLLLRRIRTLCQHPSADHQIHLPNSSTATFTYYCAKPQPLPAWQNLAQIPPGHLSYMNQAPAVPTPA